MNNIPEILLSNIIIVSIGALVISGVTAIWKNARVARLLWLILLLKLITPPLLQLPLLGSAPDSAIATEQKLPISTDTPSLVLIKKHMPRHAQYMPASPKSDPVAQSSLNLIKQNKPDITVICGSWIKTATAKINFLYIWIAGSAVWILINTWQVYHLCRLTANSTQPSKRLQHELSKIAGNLRLKTVPKLLFIDSMISPCVWAWKRSSYILISKKLFARMDRHQQQTILAHEMAHLRQGDHWLRWLELVIIAVYWWFPVAWWIVKQLHKSGEYCCDYYVYDIYPNKIKAYARALVETVECLSNTNKKVAVLGVRNLSGPMLLKKRIKLITEMKGQTKMKMNWTTKIVAVLIAASTITLSVGYANDKGAELTYNETVAAEIIKNIGSIELSDETKELIRDTIIDTLDNRGQFITSEGYCISNAIMMGNNFDLNEMSNYVMSEGDIGIVSINDFGSAIDLNEYDEMEDSLGIIANGEIQKMDAMIEGSMTELALDAMIEGGMSVDGISVDGISVDGISTYSINDLGSAINLNEYVEMEDSLGIIANGEIQEMDAMGEGAAMQIKSLEKQIELLSKQLTRLKSKVK